MRCGVAKEKLRVDFGFSLEPRKPWVRVGDVVDFRAVRSGPVTERGLIVREGPELVCGVWVVWLHGKSGCVAVDCCTRSESVT